MSGVQSEKDPTQSYAWTSVVIPGQDTVQQDTFRNKANFVLTQVSCHWLTLTSVLSSHWLMLSSWRWRRTTRCRSRPRTPTTGGRCPSSSASGPAQQVHWWCSHIIREILDISMQLQGILPMGLYFGLNIPDVVTVALLLNV